VPNWKNRPFRATAVLPGRAAKQPREDAPERILQPRREEQVPVEASFPLVEASRGFERFAAGSKFGKIVLVTA